MVEGLGFIMTPCLVAITRNLAYFITQARQLYGTLILCGKWAKMIVLDVMVKEKRHE